MTPEPILPPYIDSTMVTCFRSCPRKFYQEFILGLRPPGISIDLHAGGCFASALETVYKAVWESNKPIDEALRIGHAAFLVAWGDFEIPEYKRTAKTMDRMWEAVEEYFAKYPPLTDHMKPYFVDGKPTFEFTFSIPLEPAIHPGDLGMDDRMEYFPLHPVTNEPWLYSGRFDKLGEYQGKPVVSDDKTTGRSISSGWAEQWNLRNQFLGYVWACQQSGLAVDSVVVRGIAIQKTKIDIQEAIKLYSSHMIDRWKEQLRRDMWRIRRAWDEGYFDYNFADACTAYGNCIFTDVCQSHTPEAWMNQFEIRRWNPLQKDPTAEGKP